MGQVLVIVGDRTHGDSFLGFKQQFGEDTGYIKIRSYTNIMVVSDV